VLFEWTIVRFASGFAILLVAAAAAGTFAKRAICARQPDDRGAIPALILGLNDQEPLVRGACAWALGRYDDLVASDALRARSVIEPEISVRSEIDAALDECDSLHRG